MSAGTSTVSAGTFRHIRGKLRDIGGIPAQYRQEC